MTYTFNRNWVDTRCSAALHDTFTYRQYTKYIERRIWEVRAVPGLCELYPGICLTTEGKARKKPQLGYHNTRTMNKHNTRTMNKHNTRTMKAQYKNNEQAQ